MFKIDENYSDYYGTDPVKYPGGMGINSSGVDTTDGTPWLAKMFNNCIGWMQALYIKAFGNLNGISNDAENCQTSDVVRALEKIQTDNNTAERATSEAAYFKKTGGAISGNVSIDGTLAAKGTTINGTLQVEGDIIQDGESYETHAEKIYTKDDLIVTRDGAVGALGVDEYSGYIVRLADGTKDVAVVVDRNGNARVGNYNLVFVYSSDGVNFYSDPDMTDPVTIPAGKTPRAVSGDPNRYYYANLDDTEPIATRDDEANMADGYGLTWDAATKSIKTTFIPSGAVLPENIQGDTTISSIVADRCFYITASTACVLTLPNAATVGTKVRVINTTNLTHSLSLTSVGSSSPHVLPMANIEIMWNGTAWQSICGKSVGDVYVQYPGQNTPEDVQPCTSWLLVKYGGAFFRTEGGNAKDFLDPLNVTTSDGVSFTVTSMNIAAKNFNIGDFIAYDGEFKTVTKINNSTTAQTGTYTLTSFTVDSAFVAPGGDYANLTNVIILQPDTFQGHEHQSGCYTDGSGCGRFTQSGNPNGTQVGTVRIAPNGTNGTPRYGNETRSINVSCKIWKRIA